MEVSILSIQINYIGVERENMLTYEKDIQFIVMDEDAYREFYTEEEKDFYVKCLEEDGFEKEKDFIVFQKI